MKSLQFFCPKGTKSFDTSNSKRDIGKRDGVKTALQPSVDTIEIGKKELDPLSVYSPKNTREFGGLKTLWKEKAVDRLPPTASRIYNFAKQAAKVSSDALVGFAVGVFPGFAHSVADSIVNSPECAGNEFAKTAAKVTKVAQYGLLASIGCGIAASVALPAAGATLLPMICIASAGGFTALSGLSLAGASGSLALSKGPGLL